MCACVRVCVRVCLQSAAEIDYHKLQPKPSLPSSPWSPEVPLVSPKHDEKSLIQRALFGSMPVLPSGAAERNGSGAKTDKVRYTFNAEFNIVNLPHTENETDLLLFMRTLKSSDRLLSDGSVCIKLQHKHSHTQAYKHGPLTLVFLFALCLLLLT